MDLKEFYKRKTFTTAIEKKSRGTFKNRERKGKKNVKDAIILSHYRAMLHRTNINPHRDHLLYCLRAYSLCEEYTQGLVVRKNGKI